jgi:hypothetical protein
MKVLMGAVYRVVKELYDRTKPWGVDFDFKGRLANVVIGFNDPRRN